MPRKRSNKLMGDDYHRYWESRPAKVGLNYVGRPGMTDEQVHDQARRFWAQLIRVLPPQENIEIVTEFGCGWGRIANRLCFWYRGAKVWGIDMVSDSLEYGRQAFPQVNFFHADFYHHEVPDADLLVTCTCLQHITDPDVFQKVAESFRRKVKPGGCFVMFENAAPKSRHWHMHEMKPADYVHAFPGFTFEDPISVTDVDPDPHFLLRGRRTDDCCTATKR